MSEQKHTPEPLCPATLPFAIMDQEMKDLMRFHECVTDDEGYDVPKDRMKRLAEIGLLRRVTANFYEHTIFGLSIINGDFQQKSEVEKQRDELLADLRWIAAIAHCGGLVQMSESDALTAIRRATLPHFSTDATEEQHRAAIASIKDHFRDATKMINPESDMIERECCGTFFRTPHRSTCKNIAARKAVHDAFAARKERPCRLP